MSSVYASTTAGTVGFTVAQPNLGYTESGIWMIGNSPINGNINVSINDGTSWITYSAGLSPINGIAYGLTASSTPLWVAVGSNRIATSISGNIWTVVPGVSMASSINCVAYGKNSSGQNLFMVGGYGTTGYLIYSSSNGTTWTGIMAVNTNMNYISNITYGQMGNGTPVWVAVGISYSGGAGVAISTDGSSWTGASTVSLITGSNMFTSISFGIDNDGNKRWVAGAEMNSTPNSCIYTLINPVNYLSFASWTGISSSYMSGRCYSIAFGRGVSGNTFVAVGAVGTGTGNTIVSYNGTTTIGYVPPNASIYQGINIGYLNTNNIANSRFYSSFYPFPGGPIKISQYGNSWVSRTDISYAVSPNGKNGAFATSIPY